MKYLILMLVAVFGGAAQAAVLTYEYQGADLFCEDTGYGECTVVGAYYSDGFSGSITLDEAYLASGSLANQSLSFTVSAGDPFPDVNNGALRRFALADFYPVGDTVMTLQFNALKAIVAWSVECICGGSDDPSSSTSGDGRYGLGVASLIPGVWSTPAAVPVAPSLGFALFGLAALGGFARRKGQ